MSLNDDQIGKEKVKFQIIRETINFLKNNPDKRFTSREIVEKLSKEYPTEFLKKQLRSKAKIFPLINESGVIQQYIRLCVLNYLKQMIKEA